MIGRIFTVACSAFIVFLVVGHMLNRKEPIKSSGSKIVPYERFKKLKEEQLKTRK